MQSIAFTERREAVIGENDTIVLHEDVRRAQRHVIDGLLVQVAHGLCNLSGVLYGETDRDGIVTNVNGFEERRTANPARCQTVAIVRLIDNRKYSLGDDGEIGTFN